MSTSTRKIKYHLDQNEILQHLEHLGYKDISQEQLKDFTKDLKRLVKYDVVKNKGPSSSAVSDVNSQLAFSYNSDGQLSTRTTSSLESSRSSMSSTGSTVGPSSAATSPNTSEIEQKLDVPDIAGKMKTGTKKAAKPKEPPRHDRVALYHYYKKYWKQFNLPETSRNLNWDTKDEPRFGAGERLCAWK